MNNDKTLYITRQCGKCDGSGKVLANIPYAMSGDFFGCTPTDPCPECEGRGFIREIKRPKENKSELFWCVVGDRVQCHFLYHKTLSIEDFGKIKHKAYDEVYKNDQ